MTDEEGYRICNADDIIGGIRSPHPDLTKEIAEGAWIPIHTASVMAARKEGKVVFYGEVVCRDDASEPMIKEGLTIYIYVDTLAITLAIHVERNRVSLTIPDGDEIPIVVLETRARIGNGGECQYDVVSWYRSEGVAESLMSMVQDLVERHTRPKILEVLREAHEEGAEDRR